MIKSKRFYRFPGARSCDFCRIANIVFNKGKLAILPLFHCPGVLLSACGKAKLIGEVFSEDSNLDDSGVSFPTFLLFLLFQNYCTILPCRKDFKLKNIFINHVYFYLLTLLSVLQKFVVDLDSSKASGPDFISVELPRQPKFSQILLDLFNMYLNQFCFQDY